MTIKAFGYAVHSAASPLVLFDFCAAHGIASDVEVIRMQEINDAYERLLNADVEYRFVIDMASLKG